MSAIHIIVAMTQKRVIGNAGHLPWILPEDLQQFRQHTINHTVLMGRATYLSIGHALPQRNNIVISRSLKTTDAISICSSFAEGIDLAQSFAKDIFCIGGAEIYRQALPIADLLHISWVKNNFSGDCLFPPFDLSEWQEATRQNYADFIHCTYTRKNKKRPVTESQGVD